MWSWWNSKNSVTLSGFNYLAKSITNYKKNYKQNSIKYTQKLFKESMLINGLK